MFLGGNCPRYLCTTTLFKPMTMGSMVEVNMPKIRGYAEALTFRICCSVIRVYSRMMLKDIASTGAINEDNAGD